MASGGAFVSGDLERSERYLEEYDALIAGSRGPWNSFWGRQMYARLAEARGDYAAAKKLSQAILDSLQSVSFLRGMQYAYSNLGRIHLILDELDEAAYTYGQSLRISQETGQIRDALGNLLGLARAWRGQGRGAEAAAAVASVLHHPQIDLAHLLSRVSLREEAEALRSELEGELEPDRYAAAWAAGSGEEAEAVIIRILSDLNAFAASAGSR
jgi:tetratricopeptide (TPR) repeat protein